MFATLEGRRCRTPNQNRAETRRNSSNQSAKVDDSSWFLLTVPAAVVASAEAAWPEAASAEAASAEAASAEAASAEATWAEAASAEAAGGSEESGGNWPSARG